MLIAVGIQFQIGQPLLLQHLRKPRIVPPVHLHDRRVLRTTHPEKIVHRIALAPRIPARPDLAALGANGGPQ